MTSCVGACCGVPGICRVGTARLWEPATGETVRNLDAPAHAGRVESVAFSPDGGLLATGSDDKSVRLWESHSGQAVTMMRADSAVADCAWAVDGHSLFVGGEAGLFAYDLEGGNAR
jgi:WD40 repeat protein